MLKHDWGFRNVGREVRRVLVCRVLCWGLFLMAFRLPFHIALERSIGKHY